MQHNDFVNDLELNSKFTRGFNYKGKNIISFSSAGRYFTPGDDETSPIVISGPIQELFEKLGNEKEEQNHMLDEKDYIQQLPSSFPIICRLIQIQFPDVFVHLISNKYFDGSLKSKIVISGRIRFNHVINDQHISYYPSNRSIIIKRKISSDADYQTLTGYPKSDWCYRDFPIISYTYRLDNMKKYSEDHIRKILDMESEVLKNGTKIIPDTLHAYQTICQWINKSIKKVNFLNTPQNTPQNTHQNTNQNTHQNTHQNTSTSYSKHHNKPPNKHYKKHINK